MNKELDKTPEAGQLAELSAEEQALVAGIKGKIDRDDLILPQVRLTAALSKSVQEGDAKPGEFVNTLTGENYGDEFDMVIVDYFKGRFLVTKDNDTFVAMDGVAPENWPEEYAGKPFADLPDAEEQWAVLANAPGGEWGEGPPISTTYNYVGFVVGEDATQIPIRLSLKRTSKPTARKINTLIDMSRAPWDKTFHIDAKSAETKGNRYHVVDCAVGRPTTPEERSAAVSLAQQMQQATITLHGDEPEAPAEKPGEAREGALGID